MSTTQELVPAHLLGGEIDTHVHATKLPDKGIDLHEALHASFEAGLSACIDVGIQETDIAHRRELLDRYPGAYFAHGLYPSNAGRDDLNTAIETVRGALGEPRVCALGEIGIDRHWNYATPEKQKDLFAKQIQLANEVNLPIIVHNRDAEQDLLDALKAVRPNRESVMHCYGGPPGFVGKFLDLGFSVSFGGNVTFKNAPELREAMLLVPEHRLLLETDAPFLAPHPKRGRANYPGLIGYTYDAVSTHRGISRAHLVDVVAANTRRVFRVQPPGAAYETQTEW
ncbi:MAG: TatD family hydrolase [Spirochaetales bacterium]